jgi:hypothetical protein
MALYSYTRMDSALGRGLVLRLAACVEMDDIPALAPSLLHALTHSASNEDVFNDFGPAIGEHEARAAART